MSKRYKAVILGGSGYGGAELTRRLLLHPEVELVRVIASPERAGQPLGSIHPNLDGVNLVFEDLPPAEAARGCDIALLALPHKVTAARVPELIATGIKIVDMSADFRLRDAATYARHYNTAHPHPELLGTFTYGLPELHRAAIRAAHHVASPGCFATAIELALLPLAGLLDGAIVHVQGITGSSGSGIAPQEVTHHPSRVNNVRPYKPLDHQHVPEIVQTLSDAGATTVQLRFVPVHAPLARGIYATCFVELPADLSAAHLAALFDERYAREPFVRRPKARLPELVAVHDSNYAEVGFALGEPAGATRTVALFAALDNLIKGGAGQAIQNMNLMLGLDERLTLRDTGSWP